MSEGQTCAHSRHESRTHDIVRAERPTHGHFSESLRNTPDRVRVEAPLRRVRCGVVKADEFDDSAAVARNGQGLEVADELVQRGKGGQVDLYARAGPAVEDGRRSVPLRVDEKVVFQEVEPVGLRARTRSVGQPDRRDHSRGLTIAASTLMNRVHVRVYVQSDLPSRPVRVMPSGTCIAHRICAATTFKRRA